jgi:hypothetical protein
VAIMHEVTLLRSRITELEEVNDRLSKRRRVKKTRLQKGGSLSVEEAQEKMGCTTNSSRECDKIRGGGDQSQAA